MKRTILASFLLALATSPLMAQERSTTTYIGGAVGYARSNVAKDFGKEVYTSVSKNDTSDTGYKLYAGILWGHWGVEAGYYDFGKYTVVGNVKDTWSDSFATTAFAVSAVSSWPIGDDLTLTGKLGIAPARTKYTCIRGCTGIENKTQNSTGILAAVGLGWQADTDLVLRVDWDAIGNVKNGDFDGLGKNYIYHMVSVGVDIRF